MISSALLLQMPAVTHAAEDDTYSFDQVVVTANRVPTELSETAENVTVITRQEIENGNYRDLADVLNHVSGVTVMEQGFPGGEQYVRLNGDERVLIMVDGRRVNLGKTPGSYGKRATYDLNNFPTLANVERIEIVKGAGSALYGSDAVGGVINIITRKGSENHSTIDMGTGSWGTRNYTFTNEGSEKGWSWFLTAGKKEQDDYSHKDFKTGDVKDMANSSYDQKNITFRLDKEFDADHSVTFDFEHVNGHKGQPGMAPGYSLHYDQAYLDTLTNNWAVTYNFNQMKDTAGYLRVYQNYYTYGYHDPEHSYNDSTYHDKETAVDWQNGWRLNADHLLVGGAEWRKTQVNYPGFFGDKDFNNRAVYLEDRINFTDKWTFTPGIRYDDHSMFGGKTTPKATLNYKMDNTTNVYASWGKVFNAPTADDLFWPDQGYMKGNPDLKPETGYTTTLGINKKLSAKTEVMASLFHSQLNDAITWAPDSSGVWVPSNVNKQRKRGGEFSVNTILSPNWSVKAGYSYVNIKNQDYGSSNYERDIYNVEPNGYHFSLDYKNQVWNVELTGTGASGRSTQGFTSSHYWVWDLAVNYKFDNNLHTYVKVNNITNQAYELYGSTSLGAFPMASRSYQAGIQYCF